MYVCVDTHFNIITYMLINSSTTLCLEWVLFNCFAGATACVSRADTPSCERKLRRKIQKHTFRAGGYDI